MLISADSKTLLRQLAHTGSQCSYLSAGPSVVGIAHLKLGQGYTMWGQGNVYIHEVWCDFLPLTLSGVVWYGSIPTEDCCRA